MDKEEKSRDENTSYDFEAEHNMHSYYEMKCELCLKELEQNANEEE